MEIEKKKLLLTAEEVAELLSIRPQTLALWRSQKRYGLPYYKIGGMIRYKLSDIEKWLESRTVRGVE
jgi:excisionase family DNA binding protein